MSEGPYAIEAVSLSCACRLCAMAEGETEKAQADGEKMDQVGEVHERFDALQANGVGEVFQPEAATAMPRGIRLKKAWLSHEKASFGAWL